MKYLYSAHPSQNLLEAAAATQSWDAHARSFKITTHQLRSMRGVVTGLGDEIRQTDPDLILFFATGAIPYVLPLLNRLGSTEFERNPDLPRFHLFPGLSWDGSFETLTSAALFHRDLRVLIRESGLERPVKILCIDTTNTGGAVNKLLTGILVVVTEASYRVEFRIVGIVNTPRPTTQIENAIRVKEGDEVLAELVPPGGWNITRTFTDREWQEIWPAEEATNARFHLSYWLQDVFTEDVCSLIGAARLGSSLGIKTDGATGRLEIAHGSCFTKMGSLGTVAKQLSTFLSQDDDSAAWRGMIANEAACQSNGDDRHNLLHKLLMDEALQSFEIDGTENAIEAILKKKGLLTAAEVRALDEADERSDKALRRVRAAQRVRVDDDLLQVECRRYLKKHENLEIRNKPAK